jgi:hypothetical protein
MRNLRSTYRHLRYLASTVKVPRMSTTGVVRRDLEPEAPKKQGYQHDGRRLLKNHHRPSLAPP